MKRIAIIIFTLHLLGSVRAATFSVVNTNDSGAGSLRQAIADANSSGGKDTIDFNIPDAGQQTITVASNLPSITESVIIDGGNGGVASNRVELAGGGANSIGLDIEGASTNEVRNFVINGFTSRQILFLFSSNNKVTSCILGLNADGTAITPGSSIGIDMTVSSGNLIGGTNAAARNVISSVNNTPVSIDSGNATIQGNFIGLNANGNAKAGNPNLGIFVSNSSATIGGTNNGEGNVIVGSTGILIGGNPAQGRSTAVVQGNFIGTDATGMTALNFSSGEGVNCDHSINCLIGGSVPAAANVISGNGKGVRSGSSGVSGASSLQNTIQGNFIGVAMDGVTPLGNRLDGVDIFSASTNLVEGNVIAFNGSAGVSVGFGDSPGNRVLGNSIFSNGALGIDLLPSGVTTNDLCDADSSFNDVQNFPTITGVLRAAGMVTITGFLDSTPSTDFRVEFFDSIVCEDNGFGEGQFFLGFTNVTTGADCTNNFAVTLADAGGQFITATATPTDPSGNTSEFSARFPADPCIPVADCSLVPSLATNNVGQTHSVTVTVTSNNVPVDGISVSFSVTGANAITPTNFVTAGGGHATFNYLGNSAGTDTIFVGGGFSSTEFACEATKLWVIVNTNIPPTITCPSDITTNSAAGQCARSVAITLDTTGTPAPTVTCSTNGVVVNSPVTFPVGTTTVSCTASNDAGNASCSFDVTVNDTEAPTITCPAAVTTNVAAGLTNAVVTFGPPTVSDNCGSIASTNCSPPSGSTFDLGTTPVICTAVDTSANTNSCTFNVTVQETAPEVHDLALIKLKAPKNINLKGAEPSLTKFVKVTLQNRSPHDEMITDLTGLVTLVAESLSNVCPNATVVLHNGPPNKTKTLKPKQKLSVTFDVTYNCANDPAKGAGHEDFRYLATVNHAAIDGNADTHTADDNCPRAPLPDGVDPNPDPDKPLKDKGCGNKDKVTKQVGADVLTDVVIK